MTLTIRQKILIPILVVVLLYLAWEVSKSFNLFNPAPTPTLNNSNGSSLNGTHNNSTPAVIKPFVPKQVSAISANYSENQHPIVLTDNQKQYIRLVSQYQRLQLEKMIAQNNQAIVVAQLQAAEAQAKLAQVNYKTQQQRVTENPETGNSKFQLVYTGQMGGRWTATLRRGSELLDVAVGDNLENGARVIAVTDNQVVLQKADMQNVITFNGEQDNKINKAIAQSQLPKQSPAPQTAANIQVSNLSTAISAAISEKIETAAPVAVNIAKPAFQSKQVEKQLAPQKKAIIARSNIPTIPNMPKPGQNVAMQDELAPIPAEIVNVGKKKHDSHHERGSESADLENNSNHHRRTASEKQLLSMDAKKFTVQLIGSHKKSEIDHYITRHQLTDSSWQFKTTYQHRPWYALVFGKYSTVSEALEAMDNLPHPLKANKPFIRRIRTVQYEIVKNRIPHTA